MVATVFIDGEAGTTGLQIRERLAARGDLRLVSLDGVRRKDIGARRDCLNSVDAVILCLPDEAAREAVRLIENAEVRVIDASTSHRTSSGWTYGFPEMDKAQRAAIARSRRVSNPGCYPTGFIALMRPLVVAGVVPADWPVTVNAVSGYTGGGRSMIAAFEEPAAPDYARDAFRLYALDLEHKHVPEMQRYAGLSRAPLFSPAVGRFRQGMIVEIPLHLEVLPGAPGLPDLHATLARAYEAEGFVQVDPLETSAARAHIEPESQNNSNRMMLHVFGSPGKRQARLVAVLDNLGKGASGAAVQNLNLMLGLAEDAGL